MEWRGKRRVPYPNVEVEILIRDGLDIEAYRRNCRDYFADLGMLSALLVWLQVVTYLQSVQERRLARIVLRLSSAPLLEAHAEAPALTRPRIRIRVSFLAHMSPWNFDR
jgi:hypothetical protein